MIKSWDWENDQERVLATGIKWDLGDGYNSGHRGVIELLLSLEIQYMKNRFTTVVIIIEEQLVADLGLGEKKLARLLVYKE